MKGRKSIDSVTLIKMLIIRYLYGIKSERRLVEEVQVNIAYRWFCGLDLSDNVPEHSLFSQNRRRRFHDNTLFQDIFNHIILKCIEQGLVTDESVVSDGTFIPANVSEKEITVLKSKTDPECGYIHQERKERLGYLAQMTVDTTNGIVIGVDCYPTNRRESDIVL